MNALLIVLILVLISGFSHSVGKMKQLKKEIEKVKESQEKILDILNKK